MSAVVGGLQRIGSAPASNGAQASPASVTTAAMSLFVDSVSGSDANPGTQALPLATAQAAFNLVPKNVYHAVDITLAAGNYAGAVMDGVTIHAPASADLGTVMPYVNIQGTTAVVTPATGTATGTLTAFSAASGATLAVATDAGATWTVDDFKGKYLAVTGGTGFSAATVATPVYYLIVSNTATAMTILGTPTLNNTTTYSIQSNVSIFNAITSGTTASANPSNLAVMTGCLVYNNCVGLSFTAFKLRFALSSTISKGIVNSSNRIRVFGCQFVGSTVHSSSITSIQQLYMSGVGVNQSYFAGAAGVLHIDMRAGATGSGNYAPSLQLGTSFFEGGSTGVTSLGNVAISGSVFKSCTTAGVLLQGSGFCSMTSSRFDTCGVGISCLGTSATGGAAGSGIGVQTSDFSSCTTAGVQVTGIASSANVSTGSGSSNGAAFRALKGGRIQIGAGVTASGTNDIDTDGVFLTLAAMRLLTPKTSAPNNYGTLVYE